MSRAALVPYEPVNCLKPIDANLWIVDGGEVRMSLGPLRFPFGTRMTVIRLPNGDVWIHSPVQADESLFASIAELGTVAHLIAPNNLHHLFVRAWHARFLEAVVHLSPGLEKIELPAGRPLGNDPDPAWRGVIDQRAVTSKRLSEVVFFHRPTRTLILTDLIENFELARIKSPLLRLLVRLADLADPNGKTPFDIQTVYRESRSQMRTLVDTMIGWNPQRIILAHGRWFPSQAVAEIRRAFAWVGPATGATSG